ncbi:MAG TPA: DoxX family protein [Longimicrobium sp.]|jgi:hypothetical protein
MQSTATAARSIAIPAHASSIGGVAWTGRVISAITALFLLLDGAGKVLEWAVHMEGSMKLGYPEHSVRWIGLALVFSTILYVLPRTAILGAILLTGYLGGAVATQVRADDPWFLFPIAFGVLVWAGLYLRDEELRALVPLRR